MPFHRPRKPTYLDQLFNSILDVNKQLQQARTERERDFFTKKIQDLEMLRRTSPPGRWSAIAAPVVCRR